MSLTAEQEARDMLVRMGFIGAPVYLSSEIAELTELLAWKREVLQWQAEGGRLAEREWRWSALFSFGAWWADRPWRKR